MFDSGAYRNSPIGLQSVLASARGWLRRRVREGARFERVLAEVSRTQWLDRESLCEMQWRRLERTLRYAARNVPYYRRKFAESGLDIETAIATRDLSSIPVLSREHIIGWEHHFVAAGEWPRLRFSGTTAGTTGTPLRVWQDLDAVVREHAFRWRQLQWAGYRRGEPRAWIRGDMVVPFGHKEPPFWREDRGERMLMMSSFHLSEKNAASYLKALAEWDPVLIQAYPSSIGFLARYLEATGKYFHGTRLRAVMTSSELLQPPDRERIQKRFGVQVYDRYGAFERVASISTCEKGNYHLETDYGFAELHEQNGTCGLVSTGFNNLVMPLARYSTGDSVRMASHDCTCGRAFPVVEEVIGRDVDSIVLPDGTWLGAADIILKGLERVAEAQVRQERPDGIRILVVPLDGFGPKQEKKVLDSARQYLGDSVSVSVEQVSGIPRTASGKFRMVVNTLKQSRQRPTA